MLGELIRRAGFWTADFFRGSPVLKHYKDIRNKMTGNEESPDVLSNLLKYAKNNVPFYADIDEPVLVNFPIVKKSDFADHFDDLQSKDFSGKDLHWVSTSGTTGMPFTSSQNKDKRNRTIADLIYFHKANGWNFGEKYVFLRAWTTDYIVSKFKKYLQNYMAFELINFNSDAKEEMRQVIKKDKKIKVIIGYASGVETFLYYLEEKGDNSGMFHITAIFTDSDLLSDSTKSRLEKMFACPVMNRYSNEEQGILACTAPYENLFRLNTASYYFELLKLNSDEPAAPGETGRLIVTDLYNRSTPFIRYDTDDLAVSDDTDRMHIKTLTSLQGRVSDLIKDPNGNMVCATTLSSYFREFYKLIQYQLIQDEENHYLFKVVCHENAYEDDYLLDTIKKILGATANIELVHVQNIPFEKSGKYKTVKNLYNSNQIYPQKED